MAPAIRACNLVRGFGSGKLRTLALRDVSFQVEPGEMSLLIGPSGSGKSTLLAVVSGLLHPETGTVHALGQDIWRMTDRQREAFRLKCCGFIFQGYNLFPALTARQQLEIVLKWGNRLSSRDARLKSDAMLAELGLAGKERLRPHQLSGGEKQRVAIGRAMVKRPPLLFADEPTAALDWEHGQQVVAMLRSAARERQAAVLIVSHDPRIIPLADRVIHLADGQLTEEPVEEIAI